MLATRLTQLAADGFTCVPGALPEAQALRIREELEAVLANVQDEAVALRSRAGIYGARNVLELCPAARTAWRTPVLLELLQAVLGADFGLVRGLYFDKPPQRSWSLPWHQDLTIAVREHRPESGVFSKPTRKAGVPHVEAPAEILQQMLTLRMHLDPVNDENGPLQVLPGTHTALHAEPPAGMSPTMIHAQIGDVLAMRPLLFHASGASTPGGMQHRRVLHLEFAAKRDLPEGYKWHQFITNESV
jgi:hypothetical protein